ncbi:MAG TPA: type I 3-dehydroquinate dehydratase, partial [Bacteroidota bacterium]|nr:type I 3-dehydroquinate dehydratase [Bacteroidota bacterium]
MIIVSITGPRMSDALAQIASSAAYADILEFRLDLIRSPALAILFSSTGKPVIATCRPRWEGGSFRGKERDRLEILSAASLLGARYVDIELRAGRRALRQFLARSRETQVIVSRHLLNGERINAPQAYRQLHGTGADVVKFAYFASDSFQIRSAADFLQHARKDGQKAIAIAMGEAGEPSRILYKVLGAWATYAAPEQGRPSAPGQLTARQLRELYRANNL